MLCAALRLRKRARGQSLRHHVLCRAGAVSSTCSWTVHLLGNHCGGVPHSSPASPCARKHPLCVRIHHRIRRTWRCVRSADAEARCAAACLLDACTPTLACITVGPDPHPSGFKHSLQWFVLPYNLPYACAELPELCLERAPQCQNDRMCRWRMRCSSRIHEQVAPMLHRCSTCAARS